MRPGGGRGAILAEMREGLLNHPTAGADWRTDGCWHPPEQRKIMTMTSDDAPVDDSTLFGEPRQ